ncbi:hypothetical protein ACE1SV_19350 [Streptomyces sp. E-15]
MSFPGSPEAPRTWTPVRASRSPPMTVAAAASVAVDRGNKVAVSPRTARRLSREHSRTRGPYTAPSRGFPGEGQDGEEFAAL